MAYHNLDLQVEKLKTLTLLEASELVSFTAYLYVIQGARLAGQLEG